MSVWVDDGDALERIVGNGVGCKDGIEEGRPLGKRLGSNDGKIEGFPEGILDGTGDRVGDFVGLLEGCDVGILDIDGAWDGFAVGDSHAMNSVHSPVSESKDPLHSNSTDSLSHARSWNEATVAKYGVAAGSKYITGAII